jgi:YbbR domain-containing protein
MKEVRTDFLELPVVKFIRANSSWIITSIILAFLIWVIATLEANPIQQREFAEPITIRYVEDDDVVHIAAAGEIRTSRVTIRAPRSTWEMLQSNDIEVWADLRDLEPGEHEIELEGRIKSEGPRGRLISISPATISVEMVAVRERYVAVRPVVVAEPPPGYFYPLDTPAECTPQEVLISGPATLVDQVATAEAWLNLQSVTAPRNITRSLTLVDESSVAIDNRVLGQLTIEPANATCAVNVQPVEGLLTVQAVLTGEPSDGYRVERVAAEPESVVVQGNTNLINAMGGTVQTEPIDITGQTGTFSRNVRVVLPEGVNLQSETQLITVTITIAPRIGTAEFADVPIQISNLDPSLTAAILPEMVSVVVVGPQPLIETLTVEDISVTVDLTGLGAGPYVDVPVTVRLLQDALVEVATVTIEPQTVDVTLTPLPTPETSPDLTSPTPNIFGKILPQYP